MKTTHIVPVRRDIVDDPYSDLATVIRQYALTQAQAGIAGTRESTWEVLDWSGPFDLKPGNESGIENPDMVYYRAIVEETLKPGSRDARLMEQPIGRIYIPISRSLVDEDDLAGRFDLAGYIHRATLDAARLAWEGENKPAKDIRVIDWTGPFDQMYIPGDIPPTAYCFQAYVEVTR